MKGVKEKDLDKFKQKLKALTEDDLRDLLLINSYKLAMTRAQMEAVIELLIKNKMTTYEDIWKRTNEIFKENN